MSLIECPECGEQVSEKATACIHCGNPMHEETPPDPTPSEPRTAAAALTRLFFRDESEPQRVITTEDSFMTRSRGCSDILIYGLLAVILIPIMLMLCAG